MTLDLEEIQKDIEGESIDARYTAWLKLYSSNEATAKEELQKIVMAKDPLLKILLIRFLARVEEERAVLYLLGLLQDDNEVVVEAAKRAFDKNQFISKLPKLLPLVSVANRSAKLFAIERLSEGGVVEVTDILLTLLPHADEVLLLKILTALRYLADKKLLPFLNPYFSDVREEVRFKIILIFGALYENGYLPVRENLLEGLSDTSPRIRRAILWALRRQPTTKDLDLLMSISLKDPDLMVRQESLEEIAMFPTPQVVQHLLHLLVSDRERLVVLKAEGLLLSLPQIFLVQGLKGLLKHGDVPLKNKAILLFAECEKNSPAYLEYLLQGLKGAKDRQEKLVFIEALGVLEEPKALSVLEAYLYGDFILAYAAVASLIKIWGNGRKPPIVKYLEDLRLHPILKQMILKYLTRKGSHQLYGEEMENCLIGFLKDENTNIRYLAAQALVQLGSSKILEPLFEMVLKEKDPTSIRFLKESLVRLLSQKPSTFIQLFREYRENPDAVLKLMGLLIEADILGSQALGLISELLKAPFSFLQSEYKKPLADFIFGLLLKKSLSWDALLTGIEMVPLKEDLLPLLIQRASLYPSFKVALSPKTLEHWLHTDNPLQKNAMITLMGLGGGGSMIPFLVSIVCDKKMQPYHTLAAQSLTQLIEGRT